MRTNANITIYNRYTEGNVEKYQRTQLRNVVWEDRKGSNIRATGGTIAADQATIFIPLAVGGAYLTPKVWLQSRAGHFTLKEGDVIVLGLVSDEITQSPVFTMTNLKSKYDSVLTISSVDSMMAGSLSMRHWKVGAK